MYLLYPISPQKQLTATESTKSVRNSEYLLTQWIMTHMNETATFSDFLKLQLQRKMIKSSEHTHNIYYK